jgi:putative transposase
LRHHHVTIAPSTYYAFKNRPPSQRQQSDERLLPVIRRVYHANFECYGIRKVWQALRHQEIPIGRDQVARLMRIADLQGKKRQRRVRTTFPNPWAVRSPDLVQRRWNREAPDRIWVADFTHVATREGTVYVSFLQDAFSRRILGFTVATSKSAELVIKALDQALSVRRRVNALFTGEGVILHSDAGSQPALSFGKHLERSGVMGSMGAVGSALDNAMAESFFACLQTELLDRYDWSTRDSLKTAIFDYIEIFYNRTRRHSSLDYLSPHDYERRELAQPAPSGAKLQPVHQNG